jgi:hypothetical protein
MSAHLAGLAVIIGGTLYGVCGFIATLCGYPNGAEELALIIAGGGAILAAYGILKD